MLWVITTRKHIHFVSAVIRIHWQTGRNIMSEHLEETTAATETVDRNYLIVQIALSRVQARGGNPANQQEMKAALDQAASELADVN
jgi:hypothetical protein